MGLTLNNPYWVSDSFTVTSATTLTSAQVGIWISTQHPGATPTSLEWSIGTTTPVKGAANGPNDVSQGTASSLTSTAAGSSANGRYSLYETEFGLNATLAPGTYWFTLTGAVAGPGDGVGVYWDVNEGASVAYNSTIGALAHYTPTGPLSGGLASRNDTAFPSGKPDFRSRISEAGFQKLDLRAGFSS